MKCPKCGFPQPRDFDECPQCGVIVSKLKDTWKRREQEVQTIIAKENEPINLKPYIYIGSIILGVILIMIMIPSRRTQTSTQKSDNEELQRMIKKLKDEGMTWGSIPTPEGPKRLTVEEYAAYLIKEKNGTLPQRQQEWNRYLAEKRERMEAEQIEALRQRESERVRQMARRKLMEDEDDKCYACWCSYRAYMRALGRYYTRHKYTSVYECKRLDGECKDNKATYDFNRCRRAQQEREEMGLQ